MNSDVPGGGNPVDPGVDQLFRILTGDPTQRELAGEQNALAMFRANISRPAGPAPYRQSPADPSPTQPFPASPPPAEPSRSLRNPFRGPARWGIRLAAAGIIAIGGGMTAAAYAAVLPAPVQHLAHQVLGFAGVPDVHHQRHTGASASGQHSSTPARNSGTSPSGTGHQSPAPGKTGPSPHKSGSPSPSPSSSAATGPAVLSASAVSPDIAAGAQPVIDGRLTRSGTGVAGVTVTLIERPLGQPFWHIAGTGQTTSDGNVVITAPSLITNAAFRLRTAGGAHSASALVTVTPVVQITLTPGASGLRELVTVSTQYAHRGNVVWLEVQSADGSWVSLRKKRLNADGEAWFIVSRKVQANKVIQVMLVATLRHGAATSNQVTVPAPS
jgi:hypothetical protein